MPNFRLLGKAMIDFSRVRSVILNVDEPKGFWVAYGDPALGSDFIADENPEATLKTACEEWRRDDHGPKPEPVLPPPAGLLN